jgi:hypothetical protein
LQKVIDRKKSAIIITEHRAVAEVIRLAISNKFKEQAPEVQCFHGDLKSLERKNMIRWFKKLTTAPKFLILMQKAGGVGLNFPEAEYIFKTSFNFNPAVDSQALARALRVGHVGVKKIVTFSHGLYLEAHYNAVQQKKHYWKEFFWNEQSNDLLLQFKRWCDILLAECFQNTLNATKNIQEAESKHRGIALVLEEIRGGISLDDLEYACQQVMPDARAEVSLAPPDQPMKAAETTTLTASTSTSRISKADGEKILKESEWLVLPIPARSVEEALLYSKTIEKAPSDLLMATINELKTNSKYRSLARLGIKECKLRISNKEHPLLKFYQWIEQNLAKEVGDSRVYIYTYTPGKTPLSGQYELLESITNGQCSQPVRLYMPGSLNVNGQMHFDLLLSEKLKS